jgi:hypothetical protein
MRGDLFFKFNKIVQGENYDESLYECSTIPNVFKFRRKFKKKKILNNLYL